MKITHIIPSAAALLLLASVAGAEPVNLVRNSDLEASKDGIRPDDFPAPGGDIAWMAEEDNKFIRLTARPGKLVMWYQVYDLKGDFGKIAVSMRVRHDGVKVGKENWHDARIMMNFVGADGKKTPVTAGPWKGSSEGWEACAKTFDIPAGTKRIEFMPSMAWAEAGVLDIDDIQLTLDGDPAAIPADKLGGVAASVAAPVPSFFFGGGKAMPESAMLKVKGNRLVDQTGKEIWLQGLAIPSMEWNPKGEHIKESFVKAVKDWNANCIRLPLKSAFWFGEGAKHYTQKDGGEAYRALVDQLVGYATSNGCYVVLDLHEYKAPTPKHADFWKDAAARYSNHPGVLFDILNEPHGISWEEWRDGGKLAEKKREGVVDENAEAKDVAESIGMQALVDVVRATGARNIVIAGGLDWAYSLTGVTEGFALKDPSGNGIMYSTHVYPWKSNWEKHFLEAAKHHPIFVGEVGCQDKKMPFEQSLKDPYVWAPKVLACIQENQLNWTAWSFHPSAGPVVITDWNYTPSPFWGAFVRAALRGARFQ